MVGGRLHRPFERPDIVTLRGRVYATNQSEPLDRCADVLFQTRANRSVRPILESPSALWHGLRAVPAVAEIHCAVDHSDVARYIGNAFGRSRVGFAMDLPATYDEFLASHDRANNLRKSIRRAAKAGIVCSLAQGTARDDPKLLRLVRKSESTGAPSGFARSELMAHNAAGTIVGLGIMLTYQSTALIVRLTLCNRGDDPGSITASESTMVRYALNAFAVRTAIESGARILLLQGGLFNTPPGLRVYAQRAGYSPRRLRVTYRP